MQKAFPTMQLLSRNINVALLTVAAMSLTAPSMATELDGLLEPDMVVDIASPVSGVIQTVKVDRADSVVAEEVVAELQNEVQQAQVELAQTRVRLEAEIQARSAALEFARRQLERKNELWDKRVIPQQDRDEAEARARVAQHDYNAAVEKRRIAELELNLAQRDMEQRQIRSPIDGVVLQRFIEPGGRVDEQPILRVARIDPLRVEVVAPLQLFDAIKPGMRARIVPELPQSDAYTGTVTRVDRVIDPASGTFTVRLTLPNPDGRLPSGLRCKVVFDGDLAQTANALRDGSPSQPGASSYVTK
ncbi:MAG: efflux RND transporter periplasmic adaptor subunit [Gammaproteobacteria bacterium]|nr:efflux RND transporter periplasmic adaptor subunit [Gammaproteobacteria bacterium]